MLKRLIVAGSLVALVLLAPTHGSAQVSGVAFAAYGNGSVFDGFFGPWRVSPIGIDINYWTLCYSVADRRKFVVEAIANIPDGSSLTQIRTLSTTAVIDACATQGVTVSRGAVILPAIQLGQ